MVGYCHNKGATLTRIVGYQSERGTGTHAVEREG